MLVARKSGLRVPEIFRRELPAIVRHELPDVESSCLVAAADRGVPVRWSPPSGPVKRNVATDHRVARIEARPVRVVDTSAERVSTRRPAVSASDARQLPFGLAVSRQVRRLVLAVQRLTQQFLREIIVLQRILA